MGGIHVMGLTVAGGLPLFTRQKGNSQSLPFSLVASLNGVHMFCKSQLATLVNTRTQDSTVVWKDYEDSITVIVAASATDESMLGELMDAIFNSIVLTVGLDEVRGVQTRNVERFKRDLRASYPLMDRFLEMVDLGDRNSGPTDLVSMVETILCPDSLALKSCLDVFAECVESLFACLTVNGRIAIATGGWWELAPEERKLLSVLIEAGGERCTSMDVPVFLPCKSPTVPFRLVAVCILSGVWVIALCGPSPPLSVVEQQCAKVWRPAVELVRSVQAVPPRGVPLPPPHGLQPNTGVIGLLLVHSTVGKFVLNRSPSGNKKEAGDVLRTFYYRAASTALLPQQQADKGDTAVTGGDDSDSNGNRRQGQSSSVGGAVETYWCSEYHKLHALRHGDTLLCMLYSSAIPTHTVRLITRQTLQALLNDKQLCW